MRIKTLCEKFGKEEQAKRDSLEAKKDRSERDNCLRREQESRRNFKGNDIEEEPGFFERSWGARR
jgi:hypothetical protein